MYESYPLTNLLTYYNRFKILKSYLDLILNFLLFDSKELSRSWIQKFLKNGTGIASSSFLLKTHSLRWIFVMFTSWETVWVCDIFFVKPSIFPTIVKKFFFSFVSSSITNWGGLFSESSSSESIFSSLDWGLDLFT